MKNLITLFLVLIAVATSLHAQIPVNGDFETWTDANTPSEWSTANSGTSLVTTVRSPDAHSGSYSAALYTKSYNGTTHGGLVSSYASRFTTSLRSVNGWFKLKTMMRDIIRVRVRLYGEKITLLDTRTFELTTITEAWTRFSIPLDIEPDNGTGTGPVMAAVSFELIPESSTSQAGAVAILDDISFETAPAGVETETPLSSTNALSIVQDGSTLRVHNAGIRTAALSIALYDMMGMQRLSVTGAASAGGDIVVPVEALPAGGYLAVARCGATMRHEKVVLP